MRKLIARLGRPESAEKRRDERARIPASSDSTSRLLPKGKLLTTSQKDKKTIVAERRTFQSTFLNKKKKIITKILNPRKATKKLSRKRSTNKDAIIKSIIKTMF